MTDKFDPTAWKFEVNDWVRYWGGLPWLVVARVDNRVSGSAGYYKIKRPGGKDVIVVSREILEEKAEIWATGGKASGTSAPAPAAWKFEVGDWVYNPAAGLVRQVLERFWELGDDGFYKIGVAGATASSFVDKGHAEEFWKKMPKATVATLGKVTTPSVATTAKVTTLHSALGASIVETTSATVSNPSEKNQHTVPLKLDASNIYKLIAEGLRKPLKTGSIIHLHGWPGHYIVHSAGPVIDGKVKAYLHGVEGEQTVFLDKVTVIPKENW